MSRIVQCSPMLLLVLTLLNIVTRIEGSSNNGTAAITCGSAKLKCAYRVGCGDALQQYIGSCISDLRGDASTCPNSCFHALIALASTDEGQLLMTCTCDKNDIMCLKSKQRVEICRPAVMAAINMPRVSCRIATTICNADTICATALRFYNDHCTKMFHGKKCTRRCRNSIDILSRQEKAAKLNTCICEGGEDYDCRSIHRNMNRLCFGKRRHHELENDHEHINTSSINRTTSITRIHYNETTSNEPSLGLRATLPSNRLVGAVLLLLLLLTHSFT